ncbi:transcriptional activator protein LasR (plasmid) [Serratia marcescens]|uniref:helix-turn-helix transcriptional regulator n=1 Tax=Serratia TaxID=613 RepID=UPI0015607D6E|nr:autoinducer binding domain-containing protein [Serratia marcescens]MBH2524517.1 LuxR family transcriptional regulator [Serratia marcescens]MBH2567079.1 LuxR family transcriptional regulator [Serratia marcescens]MBH2894950.1 LuxR family transcriptional regulator [Serratia marcescens]MBH2909377.1 LuxR family transcriptional regulator [Serratia marcescens]MBH2914225.1 LuxR family transcriptional regulator [Serratia marcescens]
MAAVDLYNFYSEFSVESFDDIHKLLQSVKSAIEVEWYYLVYSATKSNIKEPVIITNYDESFLTEQGEKQCISQNPIVEYCLQNIIPLVWSENTAETTSTFFHDLKRYGIRHGVSFPLHGINNEFGILTLSFHCQINDYTNKINKHISNLMALRDVILHYLHILKCKNTTIKLSTREKEICSWYLIGKTTWEISKIINCSESNVNFHFKNMRRKFNVNSRSAAIIKAIQSGQLTL